jgi:hypothetical protein
VYGFHAEGRTDIKSIGPIAPNWTPHWSYLLSAIQAHTTTHCTDYTENNWATYPLRPVIFKWVSEWLLFNAKSAIFQIYHGEYSYLQIAPTFIYNWTTYGLRYEYRTVNYLVNACFSKILPPPFFYW